MPTTSANWRAAFGDLAPLGYVLRAELPHRWLRIYSLPKGKRYATKDLEYQALLARHNEIASDVLGSGNNCAVFVRATDWTNSDDLRQRCSDLQLKAAIDLHYTDPDDPEGGFGFLQSDILWAPSAYDQILREVADERIPSMVFYSASTGFVYSPYDGGADIIAPRESDVARLRAKWRPWVSPHPEGL